MAQFGYFFDAVMQGATFDREYGSADFAEYFKRLIGNGVIYSSSDVLRVAAYGGMQISVAPGAAFINGRMYIVTNTPVILDVAVAHGSLSRIDSVVVGLNMVDRTIMAYVVTGEPATSPVRKPLVRSENLYEICLAEVRLAPTTVSVTNASITDTRLNNTLCGIVTGLIDQLDGTELDAQFKAALQEELNEFIVSASTAEADFAQTIQGLIDDLSQLLDGDVAAALQAQINQKLPLDGGTMTGSLTLSGTPTADLHAATKQYVDEQGPAQYSANITTSNWTGSAAPYTATVTVTGVPVNVVGSLAVSDAATDAAWAAAEKARLRPMTSTAANQVRIKALGTKPTITIPIVVTILGVAQ